MAFILPKKREIRGGVRSDEARCGTVWRGLVWRGPARLGAARSGSVWIITPAVSMEKKSIEPKNEMLLRARF